GLITAGDELGSQTSYSYIDAEVDQDAVYYYWLQSIDLGGTSVFYGPLMVQVNGNPEEPGTPEIPIVTELLDAYPNPFNPSTTLRFAIKEAGNVRLDIFNARGQKVRSFENSYSVPGYYKVVWDGKDTDGAQVSSGIYMYRMTSGRYISTKKIVLTK
ncbi:MAG TPA: FlgD immunoglobulin-like domain containing protein, partial [Candidatus Cloacimonadota bacterium]|nr:FlgD immunoglobulin-like domain containing protein [Candidatus Cloacimonadota bacterium]